MIAFGAQGKLKRVDLTGGGAQTLTDAARLNGGAWSPSGVIVFSPNFNMPLYRVAATGGERVPEQHGSAKRKTWVKDKFPGLVLRLGPMWVFS